MPCGGQVEALNRSWFAWLAAGYTPQPALLLAAKDIAQLGVAVVPLAPLAIWFRRARGARWSAWRAC